MPVLGGGKIDAYLLPPKENELSQVLFGFREVPAIFGIAWL